VPLLNKVLQALCNLSSDPQSLRQMQAVRAVTRLVGLLTKGCTDSGVQLTSEMHLPILEVRC
jgi:hypothetical protein